MPKGCSPLFFTRLGRLSDDSRPAGDQLRQRREEATGGASERALYDEVQGYALAPVVLLTPLGCCEKRIRREKEREGGAHVQCRKGHALFFLIPKIDR